MSEMRQVRPTSASQQQSWAERERPPIEEVRRGVWAIPVPVRGPIRFVYSYLIVDGAQSLIIDPGEGSDAAAEALEVACAQIGFQLESLTGIFVTHFHYDHWEGADRLSERTGAWVALGAREWEWVERLTAEESSVAGMTPWFAGLGAPPAQAIELAETADYRDTLHYHRPDVLLHDSDYLPVFGERLRVIATPGHTPGHLCVFDEGLNVLFSGDHVLPNITPHIALNRFGDADPLGQYLLSLQRISELGDPEVLPAHEYRFEGLARRVVELRADVESRAAELAFLRAEDRQLSPWEAASRLTWSRAWPSFAPQIRRMALDETAAHFAREGFRPVL